MGFASEYLSDRILFEPFISSRPDRETSLIVIIPAYNEPDVLSTIDSLAACHRPDCRVEVLVYVNAAPSAGEEELKTNLKTIEDIERRKEDTSLPFRLFAFYTGMPAIKGWGAGLARKVAMDEAVRRFNLIDKPEGIIVSLDADCRVSQNYLQALCDDFYKKRDRSACSIYFEHPLEGDKFERDIYKAISNYELYLRYYYQALRFSMFPEVFHTVGSAFAVRAGTYVKSGGMNRQQAGEDFYFIQKTIPMGGYFYLNNTVVIPSPRMSDRVPFGTGPSINEIINSEDKRLYTYNPDSFLYLGKLFASVDALYKLDNGKKPESVISGLDKTLSDFLEKEKWNDRLREIRANTASLDSFKKRFFSWFNMFKVVKFLNWVHSEGEMKKVDVCNAAQELLRLLASDFESDSAKVLLEHFRDMER